MASGIRGMGGVWHLPDFPEFIPGVTGTKGSKVEAYDGTALQSSGSEGESHRLVWTSPPRLSEDVWDLDLPPDFKNIFHPLSATTVSFQGIHHPSGMSHLPEALYCGGDWKKCDSDSWNESMGYWMPNTLDPSDQPCRYLNFLVQEPGISVRTVSIKGYYSGLVVLFVQFNRKDVSLRNAFSTCSVKPNLENLNEGLFDGETREESQKAYEIILDVCRFPEPWGALVHQLIHSCNWTTVTPLLEGDRPVCGLVCSSDEDL